MNIYIYLYTYHNVYIFISTDHMLFDESLAIAIIREYTVHM